MAQLLATGSTMTQQYRIALMVCVRSVGVHFCMSVWQWDENWVSKQQIVSRRVFKDDLASLAY